VNVSFQCLRYRFLIPQFRFSGMGLLVSRQCAYSRSELRPWSPHLPSLIKTSAL
jgi:hypothetical protein